MNKKTIATIAALSFSAIAFCQSHARGNTEAVINKIKSLKEYKSEISRASLLTKKEGIDTKITLLLDTNTVALNAPKLHVPGTMLPNKHIKAYINEVQGDKTVVAYEIQMDSKTQRVLSVKKAATM